MSIMSTSATFGGTFKMEPLYFLFLAFPVAVAFKWTGASDVGLFLASCVAIIPFAGLMGKATENIADRSGPGIGGLLNATFGNAAELIIALFLLANGKYELVKASITGSILGNILLVLGAAILAGGFFHKRQTFNATAASLGSTLMALAGIGLILPTVYAYLLTQTAGANHGGGHDPGITLLSEEIALVLAGTYLLSLFFSLRTHQHLFAGPEAETDAHTEVEWSIPVALTVLLVATGGVALLAEFLVSSVETSAKAMGMNEVFVGVIVVAIVGNAAEHSTAVMMAMKDKMDLAVTIAVGSSMQIALFVAPVLLFAGLAMGQPMDLHFTPLEVISVLIAIAATHLVCVDGECHWMEGVMLLAVYTMLGMAFYHLPGAATH